MSKKDEALKLALHHIENGAHNRRYIRHVIRKALAEESSGTEQPAQGCEFCSHPLYAGTKCKNCGREQPGIKQDLTPEQPAQQQEPVAWMWRCKPYCGWPEWNVSLKRPADSGRDGHKRTEGYEDVPLYTSPPASKPWVGLTEEQRHAYDYLGPDVHDAIVKTEAKLKEKNA